MLESERTSAQELESLLTSFNAGWYRKPPIVKTPVDRKRPQEIDERCPLIKRHTHIYKNNTVLKETQCSKIIT